jgi:hypothetical protein
MVPRVLEPAFGTLGTLGTPGTSLRSFLLAFLAVAVISAAPRKHTFVGVITDDMCATKAGHSAMRMGSNDAECTNACVDAHGSQYVLYDGKHAYTLSDQKKPQAFAGQKVTVRGSLDQKMRIILVESIAAAR